MESGKSDIVTLKIQGTSIRCSRLDLINHSDYFKAMFDGNFIESGKKTVTINGVDLVAMDIILKKLWDKEYPIDELYLLSVLQAACMLQFLEIRQTCIKTILHILTRYNCLKIWLQTEPLDIKEIYLKAKMLALLEFSVVKNTEYFLELSLTELCNYLGSVHLSCCDEYVVFKSILHWYRNCGDKNSDTLIKLLHHINFSSTTVNEVVQMIAAPEIQASREASEVLNCVLDIKREGNLEDYESGCVENARALLRNHERNMRGFPCILVDNLGTKSAAEKVAVFYHDKFKRKRLCNVLDTPNPALTVLYVDTKNYHLKKFIDVDFPRFVNLDGFRISGYRQYLYLYGGEYLLGKGDWNVTFLIYDTIKENWTYKQQLPYPRRHFENCICGGNIYVIGGTGPFRVIQENMFWFSLIEEKWSKEQRLPCSGRQIKCCCFRGRLFLLNTNNKCGYFYSHDRSSWTKFDICDKDNVVPVYSQTMCMFGYKSHLFIKEGAKLLRLKLQGSRLVIVSCVVLPEDQSTTYQTESVLCRNILYTLNKQRCEETSEESISFEAFDVDRCQTTYRLQKSTNEVLPVNDLMYRFRQSLNIFSVYHCDLLLENDLINDFD